LPKVIFSHYAGTAGGKELADSFFESARLAEIFKTNSFSRYRIKLWMECLVMKTIDQYRLEKENPE